jgi:tetratricopeptide (TPR) repeat protein
MRLLLCFILLAMRTAQANDAPNAWNDLFSTGKSLVTAGNYLAAAHTLREALTIAERSSANERQLAELHHVLAGDYAALGRFAESEGEYRRALALFEKTEGRTSLNYAVVLASMAVLPRQTSAPEPVIALLREALEVNARSGAIENLALVRGYLACILRNHKRYREEEPLLLDALSDLRKEKTPDPRLMGALLEDLAVLRLHQKRYQESVDLQQKSLRVLEAAWGKEDPSLVVPFNNLGTAYVRMNRFEDAILTFQCAIDLCRKTLGEDRLDYAVLLRNYSVALRKLGRKREAKQMKTQSQQLERAAYRRNGVGSTINVSALRSDTD